MKPFELIRRKYARRWGDIELMILLELGEQGEARFKDLVNAAGASAGGVGNALAKPWFVGMIRREKRRGGAFYSLSPAGKREVALLMNKEPPPNRDGSFEDGAEAHAWNC